MRFDGMVAGYEGMPRRDFVFTTMVASTDLKRDVFKSCKILR